MKAAGFSRERGHFRARHTRGRRASLRDGAVLREARKLDFCNPRAHAREAAGLAPRRYRGDTDGTDT